MDFVDLDKVLDQFEEEGMLRTVYYIRIELISLSMSKGAQRSDI